MYAFLPTYLAPLPPSPPSIPPKPSHMTPQKKSACTFSVCGRQGVQYVVDGGVGVPEPCGHESVRRQPDAVDHFLPHAAVCLGFPLGVRQSPLISRPLGRKVEFMGLIEALSIGLKGDISNFDFSDDGPGAEFILTRPPRRWPRVRAAPPRPRRGGSRPPPRALQRHPPHPSRVHGWGQLA